MKSILISIRPKWCELIASGEKTIEVRKTKPNIETPFKCYIYCTKPTYEHEDFFVMNAGTEKASAFYGGGKVIGEFVCDKIYPIHVFPSGSIHYWNFFDLENSCLSIDEAAKYIGRNKTGSGWHISDLVIYDEPKEINEFYILEKCHSCKKSGYESAACVYDNLCKIPKPIKRPPQSWCYVES